MSRDTSFYYSFLVLPPVKRQAIVAVWDFCRAVDDAVDEGGDAVAELATWRRELAAVYEPDRIPATSQGRALRPLVQAFGLPREEFESLIDGVAMDIEHVRYPTFDALQGYCRRVAGTVGLICLEIFGHKDRASREYALHLATALQLTNIIRDIAADLQQGRVYLPTEDLELFCVTEDDLREGQVNLRVRSLLEFECGRAHEYFRRASATLPAVDRRRLLAAEIMGGIYFGLLKRIEDTGYDVFSSRIRVPRPERLFIALRIWARSLLGLSNPLGG
ncbi:MAG: squalene/phytoene synthase family protein [Vicinamibacterales bacterium]